ncbi:BMC domain-containing protein [Crassaminicella thermophila]|uniref:BMC domain-containing protein n=1 Tax=Crassaminicella thermophila TaxID=2599308 RepID=A0A5C0SDY6_CRATE|nr:BMC domain-containing protein [Crassaminicella thermophila]QEK11474.1 BMC domain-containing protein [Crassaminicella thermophila]
MQALGLIETKGLIAATESADAMLKSADVKLLEKTYVGGGLVSITVTGDVGAVKAAVEAGVAAVMKIDEKLLISQHVIPRPHEELNSIITVKPEVETLSEEIVTVENSKINDTQEETKASMQINFSNVQNKDVLDKLVLEYGLEKTIEALKKFKVVELRNLARKYKDFGITGRKISKAGKKILILEFRKYYESLSNLEN